MLPPIDPDIACFNASTNSDDDDIVVKNVSFVVSSEEKKKKKKKKKEKKEKKKIKIYLLQTGLGSKSSSVVPPRRTRSVRGQAGSTSGNDNSRQTQTDFQSRRGLRRQRGRDERGARDVQWKKSRAKALSMAHAIHGRTQSRACEKNIGRKVSLFFRGFFIAPFAHFVLLKKKKKSPQRVIWKAVSGMLPKNRLRRIRMQRLRIFLDDIHPHTVRPTTPGLSSLRSPLVSLRFRLFRCQVICNLLLTNVCRQTAV
jgi:hypothetical protein